MQELRKKFVCEELVINEDYGKIFSFIDFGNVNNWFENDNQDWDFNPIGDDKKVAIDIKK